MTTYTKDSILEQLRSKEMIVTFNKVNGDERVMTCTLKPELIPESVQPKETGREPTAKELENIRVYDVNAQGWRSFKVANVTNVQTMDEAHTEIVDALANKSYFYNLRLWGYGGEAAYIEIDKDAYEFWHKHVEEHGNSDLTHYMVCAEEDEFEFNDLEEVPENARFLQVHDDDDTYSTPWYEAANEFDHQWGVDWGHARITLEEVDSAEFNANVIKEFVDGDDVSAWASNIEEQHNYEFEMVEMGVSSGESTEPKYVCQFYSSEKGTFFDGTIETKKPFDPLKLKFFTEEFLNGEDTVVRVEYDGVEIDNQGGDTNGKGYDAYIWQN